MNLMNSFRSYLLDEEFKITMIENKIDVVNYDSIGHFDSSKVMIHYKNKTLLSIELYDDNKTQCVK